MLIKQQLLVPEIYHEVLSVSQSVSQSFATSEQSRPLYKALLFLVAKITLDLSGRGY